MDQIAELERRITAGLDRLARGIVALAETAPAPAGTALPETAPPETAAAPQGGLAALTEELEAERMVSAQIAERLRAVREREGEECARLQAELDRLSRLLDEQGLEVHRMRSLVVQLREQLRLQREAAEEGVSDPEQINRALHLELEALRIARQAEIVEMGGILAELEPLVAAAEAAGATAGGADA